MLYGCISYLGCVIVILWCKFGIFGVYLVFLGCIWYLRVCIGICGFYLVVDIEVDEVADKVIDMALDMEDDNLQLDRPDYHPSMQKHP